MPKLIIIRGNSGSGKTSLAKALQRRFGRNTMVISQDVVRREMLWVHDNAQNEAIPLLQELVRYGRKHSDVTILEGILYSEVYAPLFQTAVEEFGDHIYAYYYDIPFEETLKRHKTKPNRFDFGEEHMRQWWKEKDLIGSIPETMLSKDVSLIDVEKMIVHAIENI